MTTKINPLAHVLPAQNDTIKLAGVELAFEPLGLDALAVFSRRHPELAGAFLGDKSQEPVEISKEDEKALQATIIALAVATADAAIDFEATAESVKNVTKLEREIALTKIMNASFPDVVVESAEGKAAAPAKTIAAGPKPKTRKKTAKATA